MIKIWEKSRSYSGYKNIPFFNVVSIITAWDYSKNNVPKEEVCTILDMIFDSKLREMSV